MASNDADAPSEVRDLPPGRRPELARGRKRESGRTDAILAAASELLMEVGVDRFRIQDLAERAGSGTGAIYRRWTTKEALIAEVIRNMPSIETPTTEDAHEDLRQAIRHKFAALYDQPDLIPSMLVAMRNDEIIAEAVDERYKVHPIRNSLVRVLGEDHPLLDLLTEIVPALAVYRATLGHNAVHETDLATDVMTIVDYLLAADESAS